MKSLLIILFSSITINAQIKNITVEYGVVIGEEEKISDKNSCKNGMSYFSYPALAFAHCFLGWYHSMQGPVLRIQAGGQDIHSVMDCCVASYRRI